MSVYRKFLKKFPKIKDKMNGITFSLDEVVKHYENLVSEVSPEEWHHDQGQVTETGKPVPQEATTPRRPIFKIFFTIYVNMYSMEFFSDHNGICYRKFDQRTAQRYCSCSEIFR
jgi:hypothetical protein